MSPIEYAERPRKGREQYIKAATCDRCGANAFRPFDRVACEINTLQRPNQTGNFPQLGFTAVLCHNCADDLEKWIARDYER